MVGIVVTPPAAFGEGSQPASGRVPTSGHTRGLLYVTGLRPQVSMLLDCALRAEGDVVCRLEGEVLLREEMPLVMDVTEAARESVRCHHIEGHHGRLVIQPGGRVRRPEVAIHGDLPECRGVGTNRLAFKLVPTLGQRAVAHFGRSRVEVGH